MRNKQTDIDNILIGQLELLSDDKLKGDKLRDEVAKAKAMSGLAAQVINSRRLQLDAVRLVSDSKARAHELPEGFEVKNQHKLID